MKRMIQLALVASVLVGPMAAGVAVAGTDVSKFPLLKAVPEDVFIAVAARENNEREFLNEYWSRVFEEFSNQGILTDVWDLLTQNVSDENLEQVEELHDRFADLFKEVAWGDLFGKEMIYTARFDEKLQGSSPYQGLLLGRMTEKDAKANVKAIKAILEEFVKLIETEAGEGQVVLQEMEMPGIGAPVVMFGPSVVPQLLIVGQEKDVVFVAIMNRNLLQDTLGLLTGKAKGPSLIASDKFKKAFDDLPDPEDSLVFFDMANLIDRLNVMLKAIAGPEPKLETPATTSAPEQVVVDDRAELRMVTKVIDEISIFQTMAAVEWTEGYRVFGESYTTLKPDAESKGLYRVIADIKSKDEYSKFIPQEAESFSYCSGISFSALYAEIIKFVRKNIPDGEEVVKQLEMFQKDTLGLDIDKDILSLFAGPFVSASMRGGQDWVIMAKVTDEAKMKSQIARMLAWAQEMMGQESGLMLTPVDVGAKEPFTQMAHPFLMMMGGMAPPVIGCDQGYVMLASSGEVVRMCLETSSGKHPNITKSERWNAEALVPKTGKVDSISFTDQTNLATELQQTFVGMGTGLGMIGMFGQDMPPEMRRLFASLPPILSKLSNVVRHMNFFQSTADYSTFDGKAWHSRSVQNYKKSAPKLPSITAPQPVGDDDADDDADDAEDEMEDLN